MTQRTEMDATQLAELEAKPWDINEWHDCAMAFRGDGHRRTPDGLRIENEYKRWHSVMQGNKQLHPCVTLMLDTHRPKSVDQLCLEWAHVAESDDTRIAYTRNDADGASDRKLVTSIGKYLSRHWPHVADHIRRDVQAYYVPDQRIIVTTTPEMIRAVEDGPRSCMASVHGSISFNNKHASMMRDWFQDPMRPEPPWGLHPYNAYRPDLGWSMAVRWAAQPDKTMRLDGRALIYTGPQVEKPVFVRTYKRNTRDPISGWSETDFALHTWLEKNGYVKVESWPEGVRLFAPVIRQGDASRRLPYVDGGRRLFMPTDTPDLLKLTYLDHQTEDGYWAECTSGVVLPNRPRRARNANGGYDSLEEFAADNDYDEDDCAVCEDCGCYHHRDDSYSVLHDENRTVCDRCIDNYTMVTGSGWNGREVTYYVYNDDACSVEDSHMYVDASNLPDSVVRTFDDTFILRDDAVWIESVSEYYPADHDNIVIDINGDAQLREDCIRVHDTEEWLLTEDAFESSVDSGVWFEMSGDRDEYDEARTEEEYEEPTETPMALCVPQAA